MATLIEIERLAKDYAAERADLNNAVAALVSELEASRRRALPKIKRLVASAKQAHAALYAAVDQSPALFEKPRTQVAHGVKFGMQKAKGKIEWEDDDQVVKLIRKHFPDQFDVLVITEYRPVKSALMNLTVKELKSIAVQATEDGDVVVIKDAVGNVDKLVKALLKEDVEGVEG